MTTTLGTCHHDCPDSCGWVATVENALTSDALTDWGDGVAYGDTVVQVAAAV